MKTPIVDQMIKNLEWQTTKSQWTTQRNIDLLAELKVLKLALTIPDSSLQLNEKQKIDFEQWLEAYNYKRNINGFYKKDNKVYNIHLLHKMYFEYLDNI